MWLQTFTGRKFDPLTATAADIDINDIAHALSNICRFGGHVREFYSVAQHSVLVSRFLHGEHKSVELALAGLLHDAAEAYIGDVVKPIKRELPKLARIENRLMKLIFGKYNITWGWNCEEIHAADRAIMLAEKRDMMAPEPEPWIVRGKPWEIHITPVGPKAAMAMFAEQFTLVAVEEKIDARPRP